MNSILDHIIIRKRLEVAGRKIQLPVSGLERSVHFTRKTISLRKALLRSERSGIIAEFKRKSPSRGIINGLASVKETTTGYVRAGATALSILTDGEFFAGSSNDLLEARAFNDCPILRKDFVIDEYQILEAKSWGADVILLIASVLDAGTMKLLTAFAHSLGLEVLMEIHNENEFRTHEQADTDLIGVNNRDLATFEVDLETSMCLSSIMPKTAVKVSESGIDSPHDILLLRNAGFHGFLMGQSFMEKAVPELAAHNFMKELRRLESNSALS